MQQKYKLSTFTYITCYQTSKQINIVYLHSVLLVQYGCHQWSRNCLRFRNTGVNPRILVGFVLFNSQLSVYCFVGRYLLFRLFSMTIELSVLLQVTASFFCININKTFKIFLSGMCTSYTPSTAHTLVRTTRFWNNIFIGFDSSGKIGKLNTITCNLKQLGSSKIKRFKQDSQNRLWSPMLER